MIVHTEVAIIRTHEDGRREATLMVTPPNEKNVKLGVPFLYRYLRETRRADAPLGFEFAVLADNFDIALDLVPLLRIERVK